MTVERMKTGDPIDCGTFRQFAYHFQANEVPEAQHQRLQQHLDRCEDCAGYLAIEDSFLRFLKARLRRVPAPPELEERIRASLEREAPALDRRPWGWLYAPGTAAAAAALVLALVLGPVLFYMPGGIDDLRADVVHVERAVTVVDLQCDQAGRTLQEQRGCRHDQHVNALKLADGAYWNLSLGQDRARSIVLDPERRGQRMVVEGDFYPGLATIHLTGIREPAPVTL